MNIDFTVSGGAVDNATVQDTVDVWARLSGFGSSHRGGPINIDAPPPPAIGNIGDCIGSSHALVALNICATADVLSSALRKLPPSLTSLDISPCTLLLLESAGNAAITDTLTHTLQRLPHLASFTVDDIVYVGVEWVHNLPPAITSLTPLHLPDSSEMLHAMGHALPNLRSLTAVDLSHHYLDADDIHEFIQILEHTPIRYLNLTDTSIDDAITHRDDIRFPHRLETLILSDNLLCSHIADVYTMLSSRETYYNNIVTNLSRLPPTLTALHMNNNANSNDRKNVISNVLREVFECGGAKNLTELHLRSCATKCVYTLLEHMPRCIRALHLGGDITYINDSGAKLLANFAAHSNLTTLDICGAPIGDEGATHLAQNLDPMIIDLDLRNTNIGAAGKSELIEAVSRGNTAIDETGNSVGDPISHRWLW
jgi:hypothetical protein